MTEKTVAEVLTRRQEKLVEDLRAAVCCDTQAKRNPVAYLWTGLNWNFLRLMAEIAHYADHKYGRCENYTDSDLVRDKSPVNHIAEHARQYMTGEPHDHFGGQEYHLAAIAYNAMMEFHYLLRRGNKTSDVYKRDPL